MTAAEADIVRPAAMTKAIVQAGIDLKEIYLNAISLEDYYLGVTGGGKHHG